MICIDGSGTRAKQQQIAIHLPAEQEWLNENLPKGHVFTDPNRLCWQIARTLPFLINIVYGLRAETLSFLINALTHCTGYESLIKPGPTLQTSSWLRD